MSRNTNGAKVHRTDYLRDENYTDLELQRSSKCSLRIQLRTEQSMCTRKTTQVWGENHLKELEETVPSVHIELIIVPVFNNLTARSHSSWNVVFRRFLPQ